ncbi:cupin-like domain-containing protein [Sorangium sp. So ce1389]|uniref:cupin-like domain-containing protein n=1 Tax=Sorangium sp. So ce1389 TaxID=3133336 RepID=UPI003F62F53B
MLNLVSMGLQVSEIERVTSLSVEAFRRTYYKTKTPVVIEGGASSWTRRWSFDWLDEKYGSRDIAYSTDPVTADKVGHIRLRDYLRSLDSTELYGDQLEASDFPRISDYYEVPKYVPMPRQLTIALWIGPSGTISHFHKDYYYQIPFLRNENCFVQICGKKQFVLVPPEYDDCMSVAGSDSTNVKSEILLNTWDRAKHPRLAEARMLQTVLGPGDVLYLPRDHWHYVTSLEKSIALSFWWYPENLIDKVLTYRAQLEAGRDPSPPDITAQDIEEFGGMERLMHACSMLPPGFRQMVTALVGGMR